MTHYDFFLHDKLRQPGRNRPRPQTGVQVCHLQRETGVTQIVPVHDGEGHSKVGVLHIGQTDRQKILPLPW